MGKKLFEVHAECMFYVFAENAELAQSYADQVGDNFQLTYEVYQANDVEAGWKKYIPYGSDDDKTCEEIVEEMKRQAAQEEFFNKHQLKLFEEVQG